MVKHQTEAPVDQNELTARYIEMYEGRVQKAQAYLDGRGALLSETPIPRHEPDSPLMGFSDRSARPRKVKGVSYVRATGRWRADRQGRYLGVFKTQAEAEEAIHEDRRANLKSGVA